MRNVLIFILTSSLLIYGCKKDEMHIEEFTAVIDGEMISAEKFTITEEELCGIYYPFYCSIFIQVKATFTELEIKELLLQIIKDGRPYGGIYYNISFENNLRVVANSIDSTSVKYYGAGGTLSIEDFDESDKWIKASFDIKIRNDQNDTIQITNGYFSAHYKKNF